MPIRLQRTWSPTGDDPNPAAIPAPQPEQPGYASRVLLAEAEPESRANLAAALRAIGYEVTAVGTGGELVDRLAARALYDPTLGYDLVISGVEVPEFAGLALLDDLRLMGWKAPVVLIVTPKDQLVRQEANTFPDVRTIERPFALGDFMVLVRRAVPPRQPGPAHGDSDRLDATRILGID